MKKILFSTIGMVVFGLSAPASAADLAARPYTKAPAPMIATIYDWSGFYIGINGGGGSSRNCWDFVTPVAGALITDGCHNATGGTVGGQVGYRWQSSQWVFGFEGQGNWADFSGSNISPTALGQENRSRIDAFGLITGQIGYAWNNVLVYVKGGGAVVADKYDLAVAPGFVGAGGIFGSARETRWGGTVGAGLEFGFTPNWSVGVEYDHIFLGHRNVDFTLGGAFVQTERIGQDVDMGLVRLNYRWGGPMIAKY
ncbi:porin family protein [Bradyrhizobium diazoefficiens]|uniref:outer membrane protein n=1 Tax=Bradyrhizobium diazoefficiens TaxID=1355477 RepID=UPI00190AED87|nr:outer membrane beta-barrel protein [Bradyrhizobium diazoefficiens]QQO30970.1 porin family protein [Bradyrhizobium diazoefficiens]